MVKIKDHPNFVGVKEQRPYRLKGSACVKCSMLQCRFVKECMGHERIKDCLESLPCVRSVRSCHQSDGAIQSGTINRPAQPNSTLLCRDVDVRQTSGGSQKLEDVLNDS